LEALVRPYTIVDRKGTAFDTPRPAGWKRLAQIPEQLVTALLAREDKGFYDHFGISATGILRGVLGSIGISGFYGGGSTLTMQLAKLLYDGTYAVTSFKELPGRSGRIPCFSRLEKKASQLCVAIWLESHFTKDEILELYLNTAAFAHGVRGVDAASRSVFGVPVNETTTPEQLLLISFVQLPTRSLYPFGGIRGGRRYRPWVDLVNQIAAIYTQNGRANSWAVPKGYRFRQRNVPQLSQTTASKTPTQENNLQGEHWIRAELQYRLRECGIAEANLSGARIATFIDPDLQSAAATALRNLPVGIEGAVAAVDISGGVCALVGGRSDKGSCRATDMRSRGNHSTDKPHFYAAAFETGQFHPLSKLPASPVSVLPDGTKWPRDGAHGDLSGREFTIAEAFRLSLNSPVVWTYLFRPQVAAGFRKILDITGSTLPRDAHPADIIGNGPSGTNLVEQASAYLAYINRGLIAEPRLIHSITSESGDPLYTAPALVLRRLVSPRTAGMIAGLLVDTVEFPDGTAHSLDGALTREAVGAKTGSHRYDQRVVLVLPGRGIAIAIWVGYDIPSTLPRTDLALGVAASMLRQLARSPRRAANDLVSSAPARAFVNPNQKSNHAN